MGECQRCGQCCTYARFRIPVHDDVKDQMDWYMYHGCRTAIIDGYAIVMIPMTCVHLRWDEKTKKYSCSIYDTRPKTCRDYKCYQ